MAMAESFGEAGGIIRPEKKENRMLSLIAKQRASCIIPQASMCGSSKSTFVKFYVFQANIRGLRLRASIPHRVRLESIQSQQRAPRLPSFGTTTVDANQAHRHAAYPPLLPSPRPYGRPVPSTGCMAPADR